MTASLQAISSNQFSSMNIMEGRWLRVSMGRTKVLISGPGRNVLLKFSKVFCGVCLKGVDVNFIFCCGRSSCVLTKCNGIPGPLKPDASFWGKQCRQQARPVDVRRITEVTVGREKLEVVSYLCYLRDCLSEVVNSLPSQDTGSHGANSICSGLSSPPTHLPSPQEEEFTIRAPGAPCPMQTKPVPQPHLTCFAYNPMTKLCSLTISIWQWYSAPVDSDGIAMYNIVMID